MNELEKTQVPENDIVRMAYEMFVPSVVQEILARKSIHEGVAAVSDPEKVLSFLQVVNYVAAVAALFSGQGGAMLGPIAGGALMRFGEMGWQRARESTQQQQGINGE